MIRRWMISLLCLAACSSAPDDLVRCEAGCSDGRVCYRGYCLIPDEPIVDAGSTSTPDSGAVANPTVCGNQEVERGEDCDDGNDDDQDQCLSTCRWRLDAVGGISHSCWRDGTRLMCAGRNTRGQLGDDTFADRGVPVSVVNSGAVVDVAALAEATCALDDQGFVRCWGHCGYGVLGPQYPTEDGEGCDQKRPVLIDGLDDVTAISAGDWFACGRRVDGSVWCWGRNAFGSLGRGSVELSSVPRPVNNVSNVAGISAGAYHACALTFAGEVLCWGANNRGQLGLGDDSQRLEPTSLGLNNMVQLVSGGYHSCALSASGELMCWGANRHGELGVATTSTNSLSPLLSVSSETTRIQHLFAGNGHTCLIDNEREIFCSGRYDFGQLGIGDQQPAPDQPRFLATGVVGSHMGRSSRGQTTLAVRLGPSFWVWGNNRDAQLGSASVDELRAPTCLALEGQVCPVSP